MGIFDFFKRNKEELENKKEEIRILEKPDFSEIELEKAQLK